MTERVSAALKNLEVDIGLCGLPIADQSIVGFDFLPPHIESGLRFVPKISGHAIQKENYPCPYFNSNPSADTVSEQLFCQGQNQFNRYQLLSSTARAAGSISRSTSPGFYVTSRCPIWMDLMIIRLSGTWTGSRLIRCTSLITAKFRRPLILARIHLPPLNR